MRKRMIHAIRRHRLRRNNLPDLDMKIENFGGWSLCPHGIDENSVVYSFGVGNAIDWDLEMIERYGVTVHAFDPTPESVDWVNQQTLPGEFVFYDYGISDRDGVLSFYPPKKPGRLHYSQDRRKFNRAESNKIDCPVYRLSTIANKLGHSRIDVLKMDVEGSEFDCVPDLLDSGIPIRQLLVEIHYAHPERSFAQGVALINRIRQAGFACNYVSDRGLEFGFIQEDRTAANAA